MPPPQAEALLAAWMTLRGAQVLSQELYPPPRGLGLLTVRLHLETTSPAFRGMAEWIWATNCVISDRPCRAGPRAVHAASRSRVFGVEGESQEAVPWVEPGRARPPARRPLTSRIRFFWPSFTLPARQQCASAFWMMCLLDLALGSL